MEQESITITIELLNKIVNLLTTCPYRDAVSVLDDINLEYAEQTKPKIIT